MCAPRSFSQELAHPENDVDLRLLSRDKDVVHVLHWLFAEKEAGLERHGNLCARMSDDNEALRIFLLCHIFGYLSLSLGTAFQ